MLTSQWSTDLGPDWALAGLVWAGFWAGPGRTLVGQVGYPRGAFELHTGRVYRLGAPWWLMVDQQLQVHRPQGQSVVDQVHIPSLSLRSTANQVRRATASPFPILLCFPTESPAGGELTPPGDLVARRHGHRALRARGEARRRILATRGGRRWPVRLWQGRLGSGGLEDGN